jgi:hypothetical protein
MTTQPITVVRHDAPDPANVPATGWAGAVFTAISGEVTGEIIRSIYDGGIVEDEAHIAIDGHDTAVRMADIQITPPTLRSFMWSGATVLKPGRPRG